LSPLGFALWLRISVVAIGAKFFDPEDSMPLQASDLTPTEALSSEAEDATSIAGGGRRITVENLIAYFFFFDFSIIYISSIVALWLERGSFDLNYFYETLSGVLTIGVCSQFLVTHVLKVYNKEVVVDRLTSISRLLLATTAAFSFITTLAVASKTAANYSRIWFFSWVALSLAGLALFRLLSFLNLQRRLNKGDYVSKAVSVALFSEPLSAEFIAFTTNKVVKTVQTVRLQNASELSTLDKVITDHELDCLYISVPWIDAPLVLQRLVELRQFATRVYVIADEHRIRAHHLGIGRFGDNVAITAVDCPIDGWGLWLKRLQDIVVGSGILVCAAPILAAVAVAIRLDSSGPIFFRQRRTGFNGKIFEIWKFRSMDADKSDFTASVQTSKNDPRVTRVGRFIRRTSLDELPQLFNVLQGHMSIVGPRPHALHTRAEGMDLDMIAEQYAARHRVKPGLTGWAQVNGYRGELDSVEKVRRRVAYDIEYIENWSTLFDLKIIFQTAWLVIHDPKAF
jgi:Undecaprenyl-phosphate glucose phosphotransferase